MQHSRSFVWATKNGRSGWLPADAPHFDPGVPVHVAHDTLEHFNGKEAFEYELRAFGSIIFGRAFTDETGVEMIAVASDDLSGFLINQKFKVKAAPARWNKPLKDARAEHLVRLLGNQAYIKLALKTMFTISPQEARAVVDRCLPWIRLGYRVDSRRWKGDHVLADRMFRTVFDRVAQDHNDHLPHAGDRLTVTVNSRNHRVTLKREDAPVMEAA